jgi:Flp pilus assembly protein TadG
MWTVRARLLRRLYDLRKSTDATAAVEFAILLPVFLFLIFGILEIGLAVLCFIVLNAGVYRGIDYLVAQRQTYQSITDSGLRDAICLGLAGAPLSCGADSLKIALVNIDSPSAKSAAVPRPIVNAFDKTTATGSTYFLALGYNWQFTLPTSGYVLPFSGPSAQIQVVQIAVLSERVTE